MRRRLEKLFKWVENHKIMSCFIAIFIFLIPLLLVHLLFKLNTNCYLISAEWSAGELLGYIAGVFTFLGTVSLGVVTIQQTHKANETTQKLTEENNYLQKIAIQKSLPLLKVIKVSTSPSSSKTHSSPSVDSYYYTTYELSTLTINDNLTRKMLLRKLRVVLTEKNKRSSFRKTITVTIENISESTVSQIAVEKVQFSNLVASEKRSPDICLNYDKSNTYHIINEMLLPSQNLEIEIEIDYNNELYKTIWESHDGGIATLTFSLYLKNTTISGIDFKQQIDFNLAYNMKEIIAYKQYDEEE